MQQRRNEAPSGALASSSGLFRTAHHHVQRSDDLALEPVVAEQSIGLNERY
jgi:hypothetical protein